MKTIKDGFPTPKAGYVGTKVRCNNCQFEGEVEAGDKISGGSQMDPADLIKCPNCGYMIELPSRNVYYGPG